MKAIGIVGYKKSGKTTLAISLTRELSKRGYKVAIIKHTDHEIKTGKNDTNQFLQETSQVSLVSPGLTEIFFRENLTIKQILTFFSADFLIVEGFKSIQYFPRIVCLRDYNEKESLSMDLALFSVSLDPALKREKKADYLITDEKDLEIIADRVIQHAFLLPDMNCGKCGFSDCYQLAKAIVTGKISQGKCIYDDSDISVQINNKKIYLNPFMSQLYQNIIFGLFSPLKDVEDLNHAEIRIQLNLK